MASLLKVSLLVLLLLSNGSTELEAKVEFPETMIDNVDHMEQERKLSGFEDTIATDDDCLPFDELYEPVGCFRDRGGENRPFSVYLRNLRPQIDWNDKIKTIRACAHLAKDKGFRYFAIQFYGECWSGQDAEKTYNKDGGSDECVEGVGKSWANFVYRFKGGALPTAEPLTTPQITTPAPTTPVTPTTEIATTKPLDECTNYKELNSDDRSVEYEVPSSRYDDFHLPPGWYRFTGQAGTRMATACVPKLHCGTYAPGWMTGTLPSVAEGIVNRKVCFNWFDCCYTTSTILVKNCGRFYVYKLERSPFTGMRYCGTGVKKSTISRDFPESTKNGFLEPGKVLSKSGIPKSN